MVLQFFQRMAASALLFSFGLVPVFARAASLRVSEFIDTPQSQSADANGRYIVVFKKDVASHDIESKYNIVRSLVFQKVLNGFAAHLSDAQLAMLKQDARVEFIEQDFVVNAFAKPSVNAGFDWDKFWKRFSSSSSTSSVTTSSSSSASSVQSSSSSSTSTSSSIASSSSVPSSSTPASAPSGNVQVPTGLNRIDAELSPTANIDGNPNALDVDVAVIDTGIDLSHPDLHVFRNVNIISSSKNGADDNGHGTHVAGTIGAKDDDKGVVGVAPGARLWAVKVLDAQGSGLMSNIIAGIDYVTQHASEIEVANLSLGCKCTSAALDSAINNAVNAGVVMVVAAGNSSANATNFSPANNPNVITVSAIADFNGQGGGGAGSTCRKDTDDTFADFSNYGNPIDIAAPGVCINSTYKGGGYTQMSGTSMASPHVAGAAALYIAGHGRASNAAGVSSIKSALLGAAVSQSAQNGFSGDPDSSQEPLLNVKNF